MSLEPAFLSHMFSASPAFAVLSFVGCTNATWSKGQNLERGKKKPTLKLDLDVLMFNAEWMPFLTLPCLHTETITAHIILGLRPEPRYPCEFQKKRLQS